MKKKYKLMLGDCFELIKKLPDNSIDLVITSPPYSDIVNYGKEVSVKKPDDYCDWILPLFKEIYRVLKPSGSFILNINDKCEGGYRSTYIYDLISRNNKETKLKLYDTYIWHKKNGIPNGGVKRFRNNTEFIFHFCKDNKLMKFSMLLQEPTESSKDKVRPDNVFRFSTAGSARDNTIKHPAPFHKELPSYFIQTLTDINDIVLDPFSGIATTGMACKDLDRRYIGFELNEKYAEFSRKRLNGEELDVCVINQYTLDGEFIKSYPNRSSAKRDHPEISEENIIRCYNGFYESAGGFKWKKEYITKQ